MKKETEEKKQTKKKTKFQITTYLFKHKFLMNEQRKDGCLKPGVSVLAEHRDAEIHILLAWEPHTWC